MELAAQAIDEKDYDVAIGAFEYVIGKGQNNHLYVPAKVELMHARSEKLTGDFDYTQTEIEALKSDYLDFFSILGKTPATANALRDLAACMPITSTTERRHCHRSKKCST